MLLTICGIPLLVLLTLFLSAPFIPGFVPLPPPPPSKHSHSTPLPHQYVLPHPKLACNENYVAANKQFSQTSMAASVGAILEYPATYLHMSKMLCRTRHIKTKDLFSINDMQIRGRIFHNLAQECFQHFNFLRHMM